MGDFGEVWNVAARKSKELRKLEKIFKNIETEKRQTVEKLIENAAFISEQLDMLMMDIRENGYVSEYQNGENQYGTKRSPSVEIYTQFIKQYTVIIRQLTELLPKGDQKAAKDELEEFLSKARSSI